jgi:hypothetical protein
MSTVTPTSTIPRLTENPNPIYVTETVVGEPLPIAPRPQPQPSSRGVRSGRLAVQILMIALILMVSEYLFSGWFSGMSNNLFWKTFVIILGLAIGGYAAFHSYLLIDRKP